MAVTQKIDTRVIFWIVIIVSVFLVAGAIAFNFTIEDQKDNEGNVVLLEQSRELWIGLWGIIPLIVLMFMGWMGIVISRQLTDKALRITRGYYNDLGDTLLRVSASAETMNMKMDRLLDSLDTIFNVKKRRSV